MLQYKNYLGHLCWLNNFLNFDITIFFSSVCKPCSTAIVWHIFRLYLQPLERKRMINIHFSKYFNKYSSSFISFRLCSFDLEFFFHDTYWRMRALCKNVNKRNPSSVYGSLLLNHTMIIQCTQRFHLTKNKSYLEHYVMFRASTQTSLLRCMTFKYGLLFVNKNAYGLVLWKFLQYNLQLGKT